MKKPKKETKTGLDLKRLPDGRWIDQYGRILDAKKNPVGVGWRSGDRFGV